MWVLIVEDDRRMAGLLKKGLEEEGHSVALAFDGQEGLEAARRNAFDAVVLDVMMPGLDGFEVARRLREGRIHTPILMLTARDAAPDIVKGLDIGADDYLTKPFSFAVLLARLRSVVRRGMAPQSSRLQVADLVLNPATHEVLRGTQKITLTPTEFRLLEFLMRRAGRVVSRSSIIDAVWGFGQHVESNTLDAFIKLLRNKIDNDNPRRLLHTVRGFGYSLRPRHGGEPGRPGRPRRSHLRSPCPLRRRHRERAASATPSLCSGNDDASNRHAAAAAR